MPFLESFAVVAVPKSRAATTPDLRTALVIALLRRKSV